MIEIESRLDWKSSTFHIVDGILIGNRRLYYMTKLIAGFVDDQWLERG